MDLASRDNPKLVNCYAFAVDISSCNGFVEIQTLTRGLVLYFRHDVILCRKETNVLFVDTSPVMFPSKAIAI